MSLEWILRMMNFVFGEYCQKKVETSNFYQKVILLGLIHKKT